MAQAWQPEQAGLLQLVQLLEESQKPGANQAQIFQQLAQYKRYPDFNNYLSYVFAKGETLSVEVRQIAGLHLKNNLQQQYADTNPQLKENIKGLLLPLLVHPDKALRHTNGTIVSVLVGNGGLWPELLVALQQCMQPGRDPHSIDGALDTLYKVVEDSPSAVEVQVPPKCGRPASCVVVPLLLGLLPSPEANNRRQAIACLNMLAKDMPRGLQEAMDQYLQGLFALANDADSPVRREVCVGLVQLLSIQPDVLHPYMAQCIEYMLASNEHADEGVALESAEFWNAFCEAQLAPEILQPFLPRLIPLLMKNMVFEEDDDEVMEAEAAESTEEDKDQDIKPFHQRQRDHGSSGAGMLEDGQNGAADDDDDDDDDPPVKWTLRRASAAGLDRISVQYGDELLPVLLPIVEQRLQDPDWRARESAILALGAVSEGCHQGLLPFLPGMIHMLLPKLADPRPLVRMITCWAMSRYSFWLLSGLSERGPAAVQLLASVLQGLMTTTLDRNRKVQGAACSGLATIMETAGGQECFVVLEPYLTAIVQHLTAAVSQYSRKNLQLLYDAFKVLTDAAGSRLADPSLVAIFMPPLFQKFGALGLADKDLVPLQDMLTNLCAQLGQQLEPYALPMYGKCMAILAQQLTHKQAAQQAALSIPAGASADAAAAAAAVALPGAPKPPEFERDLVIGSLDMISGMAEALGPSIESLVGSSQLVDVLLVCVGDEEPDVRQSAFALVGDLSKCAFSHLRPALPDIIVAALRCLDPAIMSNTSMKAANNACWSLGEAAIKMAPELLLPCAGTIAERMTAVLTYPGRMPRSIQENCAITLGRVAWIVPEALAPHLNHFVAPWCHALRHVRDDVEKEHAFLGLCSLVRLNAEAAMAAAPQIVGAVASWRQLNCQGLRNELAYILRTFQSALGVSGTWQHIVASLDPKGQERLQFMLA